MSRPASDPDIWHNFNFNPARLSKMQNGARIIHNFLLLTLNQGLLQSDLFSKENLTELSTRLVDTQIPTAARRIKNLIDLPLDNDSLILYKNELRYLGHISKFLEDFELLSIEAKLELWQVCGGTIPKESILNTKFIEDQWIIRAVEISREDSLTTRKTWFQGLGTGKWFYTLDYAFGNQKLNDGYRIYDKIGGKAYRYPGLTDGRILFIESGFVNRSSINDSWKFEDISSVRNHLASIYALNVFVQEIPITIKGIRIVSHTNHFCVVDRDNRYMEIFLKKDKKMEENMQQLWSIIAVAAGHETEISLFYAGNVFTLM